MVRAPKEKDIKNLGTPCDFGFGFLAFEIKHISFCSPSASVRFAHLFCANLCTRAASESSPCGENHGSVQAKTRRLLLQPALQGIKMITIFILIITTSFCSLFSHTGSDHPSLNSVPPSICNAELLQGCAALQDAKYVQMRLP